ncbi:MAG: repressor LexA [Proteobacteria bacterium]|nr:repressor LexA [Pseudomonadota bacterium]
MDGLTKRQREILEYMHERQTDDGVLPSYREIGNRMGIRSTNGVSDHIKGLLRKGYLVRRGGAGKAALARSMALTDLALDELGALQPVPEPFGDGDIVEIGVYGQVAAGALNLHDEYREDTLRVDSCMVPGGAKVFALRVYGESMINDGILPGDFLFVQKRRTVTNGEIAVVMVDGESTVKRFFREADRIRLQPANDAMEPIYVAADEFREVNIIGQVVGIYRRMH